MASYYIDSVAGSDSNNGTSTGTPWQTISRLQTFIDANSPGLVAGDTVYFKCNGYYPGTIAVKDSGTASSWITYTSYGTGKKPILDAQNILVSPTWSIGDWANATHHWIVDGLAFTNAHYYSINTDNGIHDIEIKNCEFYDTGVGVSVGHNCYNFSIHDNYFHDLRMVDDTGNSSDYGAIAINFSVSNTGTTYGVDAYNNRMIRCRAPSLAFGYDGAAFEFKSTGNGALTRINCHHNYAEGCASFMEAGGTNQGGTFSDITFAYNAVVNGWGTLMSIHNAGSGLSVGSIANVNYINNFYKPDPTSTSFGVWFGGTDGTTAVNLRNNILMMPSGVKVFALSGGGNPTTYPLHTYNDLYGNAIGVSLGTGEINSNPQTVNNSNYHLSSGSPCIGTGINAGSAEYLGYTTDTNWISTGNAGANATFLTGFQVGPLGFTATSFSIQAAGNYGAAKLKAVIYADNAGEPGTLLATSNELTGIATNFNTIDFSSPVVLSPNTLYWIGYITDTSMNVYVGSATRLFVSPSVPSRWNTSTPYSSGPLATWSGTTSVNSANMRLNGTPGDSYSYSILGSTEMDAVYNSLGSVTANQTFITRFTVGPLGVQKATSGGLYSTTTVAGAKVKMIIYTWTGAAPGTLVAASNEVVGIAAGWNNFTFASPVTLLANTTYYIGYITDSSGISVPVTTSVNASMWHSSTPYSSGPLTTWSGGAASNSKMTGTYLGNIILDLDGNLVANRAEMGIYEYIPSILNVTPTSIATTTDVPNSGRGQYDWEDMTSVPQNTHTMIDYYKRWNWNEIETSLGTYNWTNLDSYVAAAASAGGRYGTRIIAFTTGNNTSNLNRMRNLGGSPTLYSAMPAYMDPGGSYGTWALSADGIRYVVPDWNNSNWLARVTAFCNAVAARYGTSALGFFDIGFVGNWGEGHMSPPSANDPPYSDIYPGPQGQTWITSGSAQSVVDSHINAFAPYPTIELLQQTQPREMFSYAIAHKKARVGIRNDAFGQKNTWSTAMSTLQPDFDWLRTQGVTFQAEQYNDPYRRWETSSFAVEWINNPVAQGSGSTDQQRIVNNGWDQITGSNGVANYHVSLISSGNYYNADYGAPPNYGLESGNVTTFNNINALAGHRLRISQFNLVKLSDGLSVQLTWTNDGSSTLHLPYTVYFKITGATSAETAFTQDLRTVYPGTYRTFTEKMTVSLNNGTHNVYVRVVDNASISSPMMLAQTSSRDGSGNYLLGSFNEGAASPLTLIRWRFIAAGSQFPFSFPGNFP